MLDRLTVLVVREPAGYTARCLEHDVAVQSSTLSNALRDLFGLLRAHIEFDKRHGRTPLAAFGPAAESYWNAYIHSSRVNYLQPSEEWGALPAGHVAVSLTDNSSRMQRLAKALTA
jgi:hypothetical protein